MKKYDVITFGSAVVDVFIDTGLEQKEKLCFDVGSKNIIKRINFTTGGGGTNSAASFSRLGFKTGFVGKIGDGHNAGIILRELKSLKVDFLGVQGKEHTGYSVVLANSSGERTILTYKGINNLLKFSEIDTGKLRTDWFYFSSLIERSFKAQEKLAVWAKKKGIKIAFNPSSYQSKMGVGKLKKILERVEVLVLNKEEARYLVPKGDPFDVLSRIGIKVICITDGNEGSEIYDGFHKYKALAHKNVKCAESTGAGDAFASGFVSGIMKSRDIEFAIQLGSANAESVIKILGAKNGILTMREAERIIKKNPVKIFKSAGL